MTTWVVEVAIVGLFALVCGALAGAWLIGRLGAASVGLLAGAALVWALEFVAIASGYGDADRFASCAEECTPVHYVSAVAFVSPPLLIALAAGGILVARGQRWRRRRALAAGDLG